MSAHLTDAQSGSLISAMIYSAFNSTSSDSVKPDQRKMNISVLNETGASEARVALMPES